jgi:hypothetical protein
MESRVRPVLLFTAILVVLAAFSASIARSTTGARNRPASFSKASPYTFQLGERPGNTGGANATKDHTGAECDDLWLGWLDQRYPDSCRGGGVFPSPRLAPAVIDTIWPGEGRARAR